MRVTLGWSFLLAVLAWVAVGAASLTLISSAWSVLTMLLVAATLAGLICAPVEHLSRFMPRIPAVLLVVAAVFGMAGALTANETWQLGRHADALSGTVRERIDELPPESGLRELLVEARVAERTEEVLQQIPRTVVFGTADQGESAQRGLDVLLVLILTVYAAANGPQVARNLTDTISRPERRTLVHDALRKGLDRAGAYVRRSLAWGALSGLVVAALAMVFDLTGPSTLAVWAGVWSVVPVLGVVVGFAPLVLLAALESPDALVPALLLGTSWWVLSLWLTDRLIARSTVRLGPLLVTVALAFGLQFGWLVGSLVSLFLTAWAIAFLSEVARHTAPHQSPLDELTDDPAEDAIANGEVPMVLAAVPAGDEPARATSTTSVDEPLRLVWRSLDPRSGARATGLVVASLVALTLIQQAQPGPTWILVGVVIGMALDPAARWVGRRARLAHGPAVTVVIGGTFLALVGLVTVALPSIVDNLRDFDQQVLEVADDVEQLPAVGDELRRRGVGDQIRQEMSRIPEELAADPTPVTRVLRTAGDVVIGSFWTLLVAVGALVDGRRIATRARTLLPEWHRERSDDVMALLYDTLVRYAAGSALISSLVGLWVFAVAAVLGIPLAPVLGVWALLWTFVPQIGGLMAVLPLAFLAMVDGTTDAIIALVAYGVVWQAKNRILVPVIIGRAVSLSPVIAMTAVLVGGAAAGLVGAMLATPLVGTGRLAYRHFRPRPEAPAPAAAGGRLVGSGHDPGQPAGAQIPLRTGDRLGPEAGGGLPG